MIKKVIRFVGILILTCVLLIATTAYLAYTYRDKLVYFFIQDANHFLNAEIKVAKIDLEFWETFPYFSLDFQNTTVMGTQLGDPTPFATAERLYIYLSFKDLLERRYKIKKLFLKNATIHFKVYPNATDNYSIFKTSADTNSRIVFGLSDIILKNVHIVYQDELNKNLYDITSIGTKASFHLEGADWKIALNGDLHSEAIRINNLTFFKDKPASVKSAIIYSQKNRSYTILPSELLVENAAFQLNGKVLWNKHPYVDIYFSEKNSDFQTINSFLPSRFSNYLKTYKSKGAIYFKGNVKGAIKRNQKPAFRIAFGCKNASFFHPEMNTGISEANFTGSYYNGGEATEPVSYFKINDVRAAIKGTPVTGYFEATNLADPYVRTHFRSSIDAAELFRAFPNPEIKEIRGLLSLDVEFEGLIAALIRKQYAQLKTKGAIQWQSGQLHLTSFTKPITNIDVNLHIAEAGLSLEKASFKIGTSDVSLQANFPNLLAYLFLPNETLQANITLVSKHINVNELQSFVSVKSSTTKEETAWILPSKVQCNLQANVELFQYQKYAFKNLKTELKFKPKQLECPFFSASLSGAPIKMQGSVTQFADTNMQAHLVFDAQQIAIDTAFYTSNNFGQSFITYSNLHGLLTAHVESDFRISKQGNLLLPSLNSKCDILIKNGQLVDFKPMQNLSKFVNEEALTNIRFSELKNSILVYNQQVVIPEMTLKSSITQIQVQGIHQFNNQFEYKIRLPLKNYKRIGTIDEEQAIEETEHEGLYLYLIIKGTPDNFKILYDKGAVKNKLKERWQLEKKEFTDLFKKDYAKKKQEQQKAVELNQNEFLDVEP